MMDEGAVLRHLVWIAAMTAYIAGRGERDLNENLAVDGQAVANQAVACYNVECTDRDGALREGR